MKECKKCFKVKPDYKFFSYSRSYAPFVYATITTWLCKECAKEISFDACKKIADELENKLNEKRTENKTKKA